MANVAAAARPRVQLGIHATVGDGWAVTAAVDLPAGCPARPEDLAAWASDGWVIESIHGNIDRGGQLRLRKGALVNQAQALLGIEKDGKSFRVVARLAFGADEPDEWKDPLAWFNAGWRLSDVTGNQEHGAFVVMTKLTDEDAPAAELS